MFKFLSILLLVLTILVPILSINSQAAPLTNVNCPVGTYQSSTTFYCTDGKNIFGTFNDATIIRCQELSAKGSLACSNKINVNISYNSKSYTVSVQRYSLSFFNRITNSKYCPTSTTITNNICKSNTESFGNFGSNFINQCLLDYDAQTCLTSRIGNDKFNAITNKLKPVVTPASIPPVVKPVVTPVITPTVTPKVINGYNATSLIKTPSSVVKPINASFWTVQEGFDYSGNLKQIYDKNNHSFTDGTITLGAKKELTTNPVFSTKIDDERFYTKTAPYQGTKLILNDKFQYGHISFNAKFPNSSGTMPAFWLFDEVKGQHYTEVDLFEIPGSEVGNIYTGTHYGQDFKTLKSDFSFKNNNTLFSQFHKYEVYKTPTKIVTLLDGQLIKEINVSNKTLPNGINGFNQPLNLIMNLNIGDKWAGAIDDSKLPTQMIIKDMIIENFSY
jgi:Glycosyl hydrolases family 16